MKPEPVMRVTNPKRRWCWRHNWFATTLADGFGTPVRVTRVCLDCGKTRTWKARQ